MDELIQAMSIPELEIFKTTYKENESIVKIIDGYIEVKTRELAQAKARDDFGKAIAKMVDKLPHPDDVANVYLSWREVEVEDTTQEGEEVDIIDQQARLDNEGHITEEAITHKEVRYPTVKVFQWVIELNKGFQVQKDNGTPSPTTSKRAITVKHIEANDTLTTIGNFSSANKACEHLKLLIGGDSGRRVLERNGYVVLEYNGTDLVA